MGQIRPLGTAGQATNGDEGWQAYLFVRSTGSLQMASDPATPGVLSAGESHVISRLAYDVRMCDQGDLR